jgi:hypothetical protein
MIGVWPHAELDLRVAAFRCIDCETQTEEVVPAQRPLM